MVDVSQAAQVANKWRKKRGSLIMALHEIQGVKGYIDWQDAMDVAMGMDIPLARIYEVLTFYNFFMNNLPIRLTTASLMSPLAKSFSAW